MAVAQVKNPSIMINLRMKKTQRDLIDQAAEAVGKNRSEFLLEAATRAAQEAILDQLIFYTTPEQWKAFQTALDAPPKVLPQLKRLLSTKSPWEK